MSIIGPSVCFKVQKIIGMSIGEGNLRNYQVQWAPSWVSGFHLVGCENLIDEFVQQEAENKMKSDWNKSEKLHSSIKTWDSSQYVRNRCSNERENNNNTKLNSSNTLTISSFHQHFKEEETIVVKPISPLTNTQNSDNKNPNFEWMKQVSNDNDNDDDENESELMSPLNYSDSLTDDTSRGGTCEQKNGNNIKEGAENEVMILEESIDSIEATEPISLRSQFSDHHHNLEEHSSDNNYTYKIVMPSSTDPLENNNANSTLQPATTQPNFDCPICHLQLPNRSSYYKHKLMHKDAQKTFSCRICGEVFNNTTEMRQHRSVHRERRHKCEYCDKSFFTSTKLRNHTRVHTDERPYACEVCGKGFKRMDHLREHARTHSRGGVRGNGGSGESNTMAGDILPVIDVSNMSVM